MQIKYFYLTLIVCNFAHPEFFIYEVREKYFMEIDNQNVDTEKQATNRLFHKLGLI